MVLYNRLVVDKSSGKNRLFHNLVDKVCTKKHVVEKKKSQIVEVVDNLTIIIATFGFF